MLCGHDCIHIAHDTLIDHRACIGMQGAQCAEVPRRVIDWLIECGHIDAVDGKQPCEESRTSAHAARCVPRNKGICNLKDDLLSLPNHKEVKEVRNRFDIVDTRPTADHKRHIVSALLRIERDPGEVEHIQDIRVDHLVLQGEPEKIKCCNRAAAFQRKERQPLLTHLFLHIDPRCIDTLRCNICTAVQDLIEDGKPEIAHADLVDIGQCQCKFALYGVPVLAHGIPFAARVARRLQHRLQDTVIELHHCFVFPHIYT